MRTNASTIGLAACLSAAAHAAGTLHDDTGDRNSIVPLTEQKIDFQTPASDVAYLTGTNTFILSWTLNSNYNTTVTDAWLKRIENGTNTTVGVGVENENHDRRPGDLTLDLYQFHFNKSTNGSLIILSTISEYPKALDGPLYVQLDWSSDTMSGAGSGGDGNGANGGDFGGISTSSAFGFSSSEGGENELKTTITSIMSSYQPGETITSSSAPTATSSDSPASTTASNSLSDTQHSKSGGLSTGAVAGIAVACGVVGLALICAAVWLLCFRRRRAAGDHKGLSRHGGAYGSDATGGMLGAIDKEMPHATESPHSAYAPDRGQLHDDLDRDSHGATRGLMGGVAVGAGAGAAAGAGAGAGAGSIGGNDSVTTGGGYAPYSDRVGTPGGPAGAGAMDSQTSLSGPVGARSDACPTPPISTRYAHLVEEGMTDDEIRRLEEEERALDAAIEDAGRASRAR